MSVPTAKTDTRYGEFAIFAESDLISDSLKKYGDWAREEVDLLRRLVSPGDTVLDVGAFIGTHARALSDAVGASGIVVAFEPSPDAHQILTQNAELAHFRNISTYRNALGSHEGECRLVRADEENRGATVISSPIQNGGSAHTAVMLTLDSLHIQDVALIKIDTEGAEFDVLLGSRQTIETSRPHIFMELNSIGAAAEILPWCRLNEYVCFGSVYKSFDPNNFKKSEESIYSENASECGLILVSLSRINSTKEVLEHAHLASIKTLDDISLLMLNKPQYPEEVLETSSAASVLPVPVIQVVDSGGNAAPGDEEARRVWEAHVRAGWRAAKAQSAELSAELTERKLRIAQLSADIRVAQERALWALSEVSSKETQLRQLSDEAERYRRASQESAVRASSLADEVSFKETQLHQLREEAEGCRRSAEESAILASSLADEVAAREKAVVALRASRSWRITSPLRKASRHYQGLQGHAARLLGAVARAWAWARSETSSMESVNAYAHASYPDPDFSFWIDQATVSDSRITVAGWFVHEQQDVSKLIATAHMGGTEHVIAAHFGRRRDDVSAVLKSARARMSGFYASRVLTVLDSRVEELQLEFWLTEGDLPVRIVVPLIRKRADSAQVLRNALRNLNRKRIVRGLEEIVRGNPKALWQWAVRRYESTSELATPMRPLLSDALDLLSIDLPLVPPPVPPVDIIIPAYNCLEYLDPLFKSLVDYTSEEHRVILVDNGNSDPNIVSQLREFAQQRPNSILLRLEENQGFVGAVNRAAELAERDFILLNTDVIVPPHWVERIMAPMNSLRDVATVTPFSNAATTCSFPVMNEDNPIFDALPVEQVDKWFSAVQPDRVQTYLPSGVGFCMAINIDVWKRIGPLDEVAFKKGYGEENDWCLRAAAAGFRNVIAPNLYVYHKHGGTFGKPNPLPDNPARQALREASLAIVQRRHPEYSNAVEAYCSTDPLLTLREILKLRISCQESSALPVLMFDHDMGGGANAYRRQKVKESRDGGRPVLCVIRDNDGGLPTLPYRLEFTYKEHTSCFLMAEVSQIAKLCRFVRIGEIFYNNAVSYDDPLALAVLLRDLRDQTGAKLTFAIHDFYPVCPAYTLLNYQNQFCGIPDLSECTRCLSKNPQAVNPKQDTIQEWRSGWGEVIRAVDTILCFSEDSRQHLTRAYPESNERIAVQGHTAVNTFSRKPILRANGPLNVGVVGAIGLQKGSRIVAELARYFASERQNAKITVVGTMHDAPPINTLIITGEYDPRTLPDTLERSGVTVCFLPSIWPETFSYVAQELIELGVPLAVFDLGAPADRVRAYDSGLVLPVTLMSDAGALAASLQSFHAKFA